MRLAFMYLLLIFYDIISFLSLSSSVSVCLLALPLDLTRPFYVLRPKTLCTFLQLQELFNFLVLYFCFLNLKQMDE